MMNRIFTRIAMVAAVAGMAAMIVSCGGSDSKDKSDSDAGKSDTTSGGSAASAGSSELKVELSEWAVKPAVSSVKPGDVTFEVSNKGAAPHELVVIKTDVAPDKLPLSSGSADEKQNKPLGRTSQIAAGTSEDKTFTLAAGKYVLLCNIPAHYGQGMHTTLTVN